MRLALLLGVTRPDDHLVGRLVVTGARTLGRLAPRGDRTTAARGPAFTTAVRMVDRVLGDAAGQRALAHPTAAAGLAEVLVLVVGVRHRAHRRHAIGVDVTLLARVQANHHHALVAADDLHIGARRACDLAALAGLHIDVVDDRADRQLAQLHRVARLHVGLLAGDDLVTHGETLRCDDVGELFVRMLDQGAERGAVRGLFQTRG